MLHLTLIHFRLFQGSTAKLHCYKGSTATMEMVSLLQSSSCSDRSKWAKCRHTWCKRDWPTPFHAIQPHSLTMWTGWLLLTAIYSGDDTQHALCIHNSTFCLHFYLATSDIWTICTPTISGQLGIILCTSSLLHQPYSNVSKGGTITIYCCCLRLLDLHPNA